MRADAAPQAVTYDSRSPEDLVWGLGLGCEGLIEVTLEPVSPARAGEVTAGIDVFTLQLLVCGYGPDVPPLVGVATALGWDVTVVDHRQRHPSELAEVVPLTGRTYAVVMSHHFLRDLDYLRALLASDVPYVGLLGPRTRAERLLHALAAQERLDPSARERVYGPAGLDIGGDGPDAIALSIAAEVSAVASGRRGGHLRDRRASIHDAPPRRTVDAA
jgi:xanthine/CO dehydrogenase XdhC/CoxF family maturation factor